MQVSHLRSTLFFAVPLAVLGTSCERGHGLSRGFAIDTNGAGVPYTHLDFQDDPADFSFAVVGDRRGGSRSPEIFSEAIDRLNLLRPAFVISVGDLAECCGTPDWGWERLNREVGRLEMPFFYVVGNADLNSIAAATIWEEQFGRPYYSFTYRDVLFIALSTEDPPGSPRGGHVGEIGEVQRRWFAETLREHDDARWTFVFLHKPMWLHDQAEWLEIETYLSGRPHTVFGGHHHRYTRTVRAGGTYYTMSSTGSSLPSTGLVFDHVTWVALTSKGPRVSNLLLDGIWNDAPPLEVGVNRPQGK